MLHLVLWGLFAAVTLATVLATLNARPHLSALSTILSLVLAIVLSLLIGPIPALPIAPLLALGLFDAKHRAVPRALLAILAIASIGTFAGFWLGSSQFETNLYLSALAITAAGIILARRNIRSADKIGIALLAVAFGPSAGLAIATGGATYLLAHRSERSTALFAVLAPGAVLAAASLRWLW